MLTIKNKEEIEELSKCCRYKELYNLLKEEDLLENLYVHNMLKEKDNIISYLMYFLRYGKPEYDFIETCVEFQMLYKLGAKEFVELLYTHYGPELEDIDEGIYYYQMIQEEIKNIYFKKKIENFILIDR